MSSADPFSSRFEVFGREPKHVVSDINQQAFQRLKELLEVEEGGDGRVIVLRAPRAGFGKTFLLQRITQEHSDSHHFVRVNLANGRTTDAAHVLEYVLQALCKVLPDSTTLTELDFLSRKILALGLEPLVASGEVPCQDREGALLALRDQPTETFDFHHDRAVTAHWTKSNFEILGPRLAAELARVSGASLREASYWVELLFRFATTAPDNVERARLLFETVFRGDLQNQSESAAEERLHGLLCMLGTVTNMVLIVDDTEGLSTHPPDALALASFLTNLSHCCYGSVVLLSVNDDIWNSAFHPLLPGGLADRLCETTVTLKPLTREQAEALVTARAGSRSAELLSKMSWPEGDLYPRHVLKLASEAWSELQPTATATATVAEQLTEVTENDPVVPLTPSTSEEPAVFDSEIEDSFVSSPDPSQKKEEKPIRLEADLEESSPTGLGLTKRADSPKPTSPEKSVPTENDPFADDLDAVDDVPGEKESAAASADLQSAAAVVSGSPVESSPPPIGHERQEDSPFDSAPSLAPTDTVPSFEQVSPVGSTPAPKKEENPFGDVSAPIRPIEADTSLAPESNPFLAPGVSAGASSFEEEAPKPSIESAEPNPFAAPAGPPPSNFLPPSLNQDPAPSEPLSALESEGNPFGSVPESTPFQSPENRLESTDAAFEKGSAPAPPLEQGSNPFAEPATPASALAPSIPVEEQGSPLEEKKAEESSSPAPPEEQSLPAKEPAPTGSEDGVAAFVAAFKKPTPVEPTPSENGSTPFTPASASAAPTPVDEKPEMAPTNEAASPFIAPQDNVPKQTPVESDFSPAPTTAAESPFSPAVPPVTDLGAPPVPSEHQFGEVGEPSPPPEAGFPGESPFSPVMSQPQAASTSPATPPPTPAPPSHPEQASTIAPEKPEVEAAPPEPTPFTPVGEAKTPAPSTPAESPFSAPSTPSPLAPLGTPGAQQLPATAPEPTPFEAGAPPVPTPTAGPLTSEDETPFEAASTPSPFSAVGAPPAPSAQPGPPPSTLPPSGADLDPSEQDKVDELLKQFKERYGRK